MRKYAFCLMAALALVGCSRKELEPEVKQEPAGETWTVRVEATYSEEEETKSSRADGWDETGIPGESGDTLPTKGLLLNGNTLSSYWSGSDKVEVYDAYGNYCGFLLPQNPGQGKTAILTGKLTGDFRPRQTLTLYFMKRPSDGNDYADQKGTLEDIQSHFDFAIASAQVQNVGMGEVELSSALFIRSQSITYFPFRLYEDNSGDQIRKLTITSATGLEQPVTVVPATPALSFYVAIPGKSGATQKLVYDIQAETVKGDIYTCRMKALLLNGKYYVIPSTIPLKKYIPLAEPLTFEALEDGQLQIQNPLGWIFHYGINTDNIQAQIAAGSQISIDLEAGDRLILGAHHPSGLVAHGKEIKIDQGNGTFSLTHSHTNIQFSGKHYVYGNVMSLISYQYYSLMQEVAVHTAKSHAFFGLFMGNSRMENHPVRDILLPATTVEDEGYSQMFRYCSSLTRAPELPAQNLTSSGYQYYHMFSSCESLKKAPSILPATQVPKYAYGYMFAFCYALEASPVLPAKSPADDSYYGMFQGCVALKQVTCYANDNLGWILAFVMDDGSIVPYYDWQNNHLHVGRKYIGATAFWLEGVSADGMFFGDENADWPVGSHGVPSGWKGNAVPLTLEASESGVITISNPLNRSIRYGKLPSLASATESSSSNISINVEAGDKVRFWGDNDSYGDYVSDKYLNITCNVPHFIYGDIRSLVSSTAYSDVTELKKDAFMFLFRGNTQLRNHPSLNLILEATTLGEGCYRGLFYGCTGIYSAPELPATVMSPYCYEFMFADCTSLYLPPELVATSLEAGCYSAMFSGCTRLQSAPDLPVHKLYYACYESMFSGCTSLTTAPFLPAYDLKPACYSYMFSGCSKLNSVTCVASNPSLTDSEGLVPGSVDGWLDGVSSSGNFIRRSGVTWPDGTIPANWKIRDYQQ